MDRFLFLKEQFEAGKEIRMCDLSDMCKEVSNHIKLSVWADVSNTDSIKNLINYYFKNIWLVEQRK